MAGDHPRAKGSLASGRAQEEAPSPDGRSERARGKADGRDKSIKEAFASLFPRHQRPQTLPLQPFVLSAPAEPRPPPTVLPRHPVIAAAPPPRPPPPTHPLTPARSEVGPGPAAVRPSPVGAYSPPQRGSLPLLHTPDRSSLWSPLFPRSRTFPAADFPPRRASRPGSPLPRPVIPLPRPRGHSLPLGPCFGLLSPKPQPPSHLHTASRTHQRWNCHGSEGKSEGLSIWNIGIGRSRSLPAGSRAEWSGMAGVADSPSLHPPVPGDSRPSLGPQHKRGLLWAVNVSVDQIVSHFSVARNIVQKAQLGDSRVSPLVGQLVLGGLCPALEAVVRDGLKPHQQDLIVGRRPNSPWSVVEASLKAGSAPRTLTSLYAQLDQLPQLGNPRRKFNAFVFGLLNLKRLDIWISALHDSTEVLRTHYVPTAFLLLSHSCCRPLFEELLLLLQPLAVLTFHLDPLFEYHHPSTAADPGGGGSEPGLREPSRPGGTPQHHHHQQQQQRAKGRRADEGPAEEVERGGGAETGYTLQQTLEQVGRWGDRLAQSLAALQKPPAPARPPHGADPDFSPPTALLRAGEGLPGRQRKLSWWDQLGHSSQIYLAPSREGSVFAKWMKPAAASNADSLHDRSKTPAATLATATGQEGGGVRNPGSGLRGSDGGGLGAGPAEDGQQDPTPSGAGPPGESRPPTAPLRSELDRTCPSRAGELLWLGRLFGARVPGTYSPGEPPPHQEGKAQRGRLPSAWLQVSLSPFDQRTRALPAGTNRAPPPPPEANPPAQDPTKPARRVRTLCDHTATEEDHLSFRRGETLEIVACVDEDWIRCCHGDASGLVPIGYTSLI